MTDECLRYQRVAYTMTSERTALLTRLRCKQWSCPYCSKKNAAIWQWWLSKRLPEISAQWWLVTLTAHSQVRTQLRSFLNLRNNVDTLIKRTRRVWGEIEYGRVYERHPTSQAIHVHMIMSGLTSHVVNGASAKHRPMTINVLRQYPRSGCWSVNTWFKKSAQDVGIGYIADVHEVVGNPIGTALYVTKYLTKEQQSFHIPYLRHVAVTSGIGSPEFEKSYEWIPAQYITSRTFARPNVQATDIDTGELINNNYWEQNAYWPNDTIVVGKRD